MHSVTIICDKYIYTILCICIHRLNHCLFKNIFSCILGSHNLLDFGSHQLKVILLILFFLLFDDRKLLLCFAHLHFRIVVSILRINGLILYISSQFADSTFFPLVIQILQLSRALFQSICDLICCFPGYPIDYLTFWFAYKHLCLFVFF